MFLSKGHRDLRFAFQTHPGSQASCRREAKDSALLSSCDGHLLEPTLWPKGSQASCEVWSLSLLSQFQMDSSKQCNISSQQSVSDGGARGSLLYHQTISLYLYMYLYSLGYGHICLCLYLLSIYVYISISVSTYKTIIADLSVLNTKIYAISKVSIFSPFSSLGI